MATRMLSPDDAPAYQAIRLTALAERPPAFGAMLEDEPDLLELSKRLSSTADRTFFGATEGGHLIGILRFSRYSGSNEKHRAYLAGFFVLPAFRRRGHGRSLLEFALAHAHANAAIRRINLTVVTEQRDAIRLYESLGFRSYGIEKEAFSSEGQFFDELLMTLSLG